VLRAVRYEESYGYKIISDISPYVEISESTLYPILKRLEADEFVSARTAEYNGRLRRYYFITYKGTQRLAEFEEDFKSITNIHRYINS